MKKQILTAMFFVLALMLCISCSAKSAKPARAEGNEIMGLKPDNPFYDVLKHALEHNGQWQLVTVTGIYYMASRPEQKSVSIAKQDKARLFSVSYDFEARNYVVEIIDVKKAVLLRQEIIPEAEAKKLCILIIREMLDALGERKKI